MIAQRSLDITLGAWGLLIGRRKEGGSGCHGSPINKALGALKRKETPTPARTAKAVVWVGVGEGSREGGMTDAELSLD